MNNHDLYPEKSLFRPTQLSEHLVYDVSKTDTELSRLRTVGLANDS